MSTSRAIPRPFQIPAEEVGVGAYGTLVPGHNVGARAVFLAWSVKHIAVRS